MPEQEKSPSLLNQNVPNPLAKNPNVHTHKVFAAVGLILIFTIAIAAGIWYYVAGRYSINDSVINYSNTKTDTTNKTSTSSAKKDESASWKNYSNSDIGFSIRFPQNFKVDEATGYSIIYNGIKLNLGPPNDNYPTGIAVYTRNGKSGREACFAEVCQNTSNPSVGKNYSIQDIKINNATGVKLTNTLSPLQADYYLGNMFKVVRISFGTFKTSTDSRSDAQLKEDFALLESIIQTFKFL